MGIILKKNLYQLSHSVSGLDPTLNNFILTLCSDLFFLKNSNGDLDSRTFLDFCCLWLGARDPVRVNLDWNISLINRLVLAENKLK